jgi:hypothetical protein
MLALQACSGEPPRNDRREDVPLAAPAALADAEAPLLSIRYVAVSRLDCVSAPAAGSDRLSTLVFSEQVRVEEEQGPWARLSVSQISCWVDASALAADYPTQPLSR